GLPAAVDADRVARVRRQRDRRRVHEHVRLERRLVINAVRRVELDGLRARARGDREDRDAEDDARETRTAPQARAAGESSEPDENAAQLHPHPPPATPDPPKLPSRLSTAWWSWPAMSGSPSNCITGSASTARSCGRTVTQPVSASSR